jgi:hypothetical protein
MAFDWKKTLATVAPGLATALGGPLAGVATKALSDALLGKPDGDEDEIAAAMATGGMDALAKIREAEASFKVRMRELDIDLEKVHQADRASARQREVSTGDSFTPRALALLVTLGFFGVLGYLLNWGKPEQGGDALLVMLGSLGTAWTAIISYYYGSSAGSSEKTALLGRK